jgi:hypothetical protein
MTIFNIWCIEEYLTSFLFFIQDRKDARQGETINIFSVASGHLYVSI